MKASAVKFDINAVRTAWWLQRLRTIAVDLKLGWRYCQAAKTDEENGFPFAAAMEWHKAAECFGSISIISERCWMQWERIVHLPRHFANPIGESEAIVRQCATVAPDTQGFAKAVGNEVALASVA